VTRRRHVTDAEAQLLAHAMKDVRTRPGRAKAPAPEKPKAAKSAGTAQARADAKAAPSPAKPTKPSKPPPAGAIDRRTEQKLKRGRIAIDATLDLHGLKQQAAHFRLMHFITRASEAGYKAVLVITGKGSRGNESGIMAGERRGVLRTQVPLWLEHPTLRGYVRGVKAAGPRHGGAGALYVLLRRKK